MDEFTETVGKIELIKDGESIGMVGGDKTLINANKL